MRVSVLIVAFATAATVAASAGADILPTGSATDLAAAITSDPSVVTGAALVNGPPGGSPNAVSTTPLTGFPTDGSSYAILTTGDATAASKPNSNVPDDPGPRDDQSATDGGGPTHGDSNFDSSILKIDLKVPAGDNCLSIDFRFLSEEYPEFVGQKFNDAFIAELDSNSWTTSGSDISAPNNFAFAPGPTVISINATGTSSVSPGNSAGTTYDAGTGLLSASTPVTPGAHSLYLSIFDMGDDILDSAVFVDNLVVGKASSGGCKKGATTGGGVGGGGGGTGSGDAGPVTGTPSGTVLLNGKAYKGGPIPYGSKVDVTKGKVTLKLNVGTLVASGGGGITAQFILLRFKVGGKPIVELRLTGGNFGVCTKALRTTSGLAATKPPPKTVRRLFTKGKGSFRTRGNYSSATIRGTDWLTADRCDGTLEQTRQGIVAVLDFRLKKTFLVKAGKSYLAKKA